MLKALSPRFRRGAVKPFALLAIAVPVMGGGVLAYNLFFNRPGESAIKLIPQNALMVLTLDITPSAEQLPTFKRIFDAVKREGLEGELDKAMTEAFNKSPMAAELRPELRESFALATLPSGSGEAKAEDTVLMLAVKDPGKAAGILGKHGAKSKEGGLEVFKLEKAEGSAALVGPYVVFSKSPSLLVQVEAVRQGKTPALEESADYQQARASLPKDANLMLFISPDGLKQMAKQSGGQVDQQAMNATRYLTLGMTVREQGLELVGQVPTVLDEKSPLRSLSQVAAVDPQALRKLPGGAYGVFAMSQPGQYYDPVSSTVLSAEQRAEFENELKEAEADLGMTVENDLVPALGGNVVVGVYPDPEKPTEGVDLVGVVDDAHAADPARVAKKLLEFFQGKGEVRFNTEEINGVTVWSPQERMGGKTAYLATAGKSVLFATSRTLLESTLAAFNTETAGNSLMSEPAFAGMQPQVVSGAQMLLMVDVRRILETFRTQIESSLGGDKDLKYEDLLGLFGSANSGLVASGKYDGAAGTFQLHLPLDYDRLIHLVAVGARKATSGQIGGPGSS